jgi:putative Ig domain-containing protein/ricin-type beta-trefoil lectin protein
MLRQLFLAVTVTAGLLGASAAAQPAAAAHTHSRPAAHTQLRLAADTQPRPAAHLPGVRVVNLHHAYEAMLRHVKPGKIAGIVYARGKGPRAARRNRANQASCTEAACPVAYNGGPVQHNPHVYLLLWGPNWSTDTGQEASATYLEHFYGGLGVLSQDNWSTITSQYADTTGHPVFNGSVFAGAFQDPSTPPTGATQAQIAAEADTFASEHALADLTDTQIVVATQSGTCPAGFAATLCGGSGTYCAWHSSSNEPYINLPYLLDAGTGCGENFINSGTAGTDDGFSLVGGAEYADAITDPLPAAGLAPGTAPNPAWVDKSDAVSGGEIAEKCAFDGSWAAGAPHGDVTLSTGTFAMQSLWSNAAGGCVLTGAVQDKVTITSPGTQSTRAGESVNLQVQGTSSAGNPLTWSGTGLPTGLSISSSGLITGTPTAPATYPANISASDKAGAQSSVSFNWTITPNGAPITGFDGLCLDDFGSGTANRNKIDIWTCNQTPAQDWTFSGGALSVLGKCLDNVTGGGSGSKLVIFTCNGHRAQTWSHRSDGEYVLKLNSLCLTDPGSSTGNGTQVDIEACKDFKDQRWSLP